jgi:hypothetical protein
MCKYLVMQDLLYRLARAVNSLERNRFNNKNNFVLLLVLDERCIDRNF